jgi:hypothetical protein
MVVQIDQPRAVQRLGQSIQLGRHGPELLGDGVLDRADRAVRVQADGDVNRRPIIALRATGVPQQRVYDQLDDAVSIRAVRKRELRGQMRFDCAQAAESPVLDHVFYGGEE